MHEWPVDGLEARGNGRIICYDPRDGTTRTVLRDLKFPNGICIAQRRRVVPVRRDLGLLRQALLVRRAEEGPGRDGDRQPAGLPRQHQPRLRRQLLAGAGRHALPGLDLAMRMPGFRKRMAKRVPLDEWLFPNINTGCVLKFNETGEVLETLLGPRRREPSDDHLDARAPRLPLPRRHLNNRIGRYKLRGRRPGLRRSTTGAGGKRA